MAIKIQLFLSGELLIGGKELVDLWHKEKAATIWVDLYKNDQNEEAEWLEMTFGLHPLAIQDAQRDRHPPKIEDFGKYTFILLTLNLFVVLKTRNIPS